jgi:photosystem II stability/assembly factor-like uncharacterized protein
MRTFGTIAVRATLNLLIATTAIAQSWVPQQSGTDASLRGVSAASPVVVWASGTKGTFLRSVDGGSAWRTAVVPGAADMDFRGIRAFDERTAILMSSGQGAKSRVYKTSDGGLQWSLLYTNPDPEGFFDAIAFWDSAHGILLGDPVKGRFVILTTDDGGVTWKRQKAPAARLMESAFAASNTCLFARGTREVWFGTGGPGGGRVFHSQDGGQTWSPANAPIRTDSPNSGIFSVAFSNGQSGVAVGGDYSKAAETDRDVVLTSDGGKTWTAPPGAATPGAATHGYRSAVAYVADRKIWVATGTSGSDISFDGGKSWKQFDGAAYNAVSFLSNGLGWAVGPNGAIARFKPE